MQNLLEMATDMMDSDQAEELAKTLTQMKLILQGTTGMFLLKKSSNSKVLED